VIAVALKSVLQLLLSIIQTSSDMQ